MMREWHQPPEFFLENWTDEEFEKFWDARNENLRDEIRVIKQTKDQTVGATGVQSGSRRVSDMDLFKQMGISKGNA